jgi:hypothetical protein
LKSKHYLLLALAFIVAKLLAWSLAEQLNGPIRAIDLAKETVGQISGIVVALVLTRILLRPSTDRSSMVALALIVGTLQFIAAALAAALPGPNAPLPVFWFGIEQSFGAWKFALHWREFDGMHSSIWIQAIVHISAPIAAGATAAAVAALWPVQRSNAA